MKFNFIHHARIANRALIIKNKDKWQSQLAKMEGKNVRIVIEDDKNPRTLKQNRFYFLYLGLIEDTTGNTVEELHEIFKRKFLPPRFVKFKDEEIKLPATSTNLDTLEFMQYMDKIALLTGVPIPNINEVC